MKTWMIIAFVAGGLLLVVAGALPLWVWAVMAALVLFLRVIAPRLNPNVDELAMSDEGITRQYGTRGRQASIETVRWGDLTRVDVLTHETGPARKDMLFLLYGSGENGVAVPGALAQQQGLVATLRKRLPGFRDELLGQAQAAAERASFTLWEKDAGTGA
jgi:hypothetical protein